MPLLWSWWCLVRCCYKMYKTRTVVLRRTQQNGERRTDTHPAINRLLNYLLFLFIT